MGWLSWGRSESQASINEPKRRVDERQEAWILGTKMPIERRLRRVKILSSVRRRRRKSSGIRLQRQFRGVEKTINNQLSMDEQGKLTCVGFLQLCVYDNWNGQREVVFTYCGCCSMYEMRSPRHRTRFELPERLQ
jgi:hypothetical protein